MRRFRRLRPSIWLAVAAAVIACVWWWSALRPSSSVAPSRARMGDGYDGSSGMGADGFGGWPSRPVEGDAR